MKKYFYFDESFDDGRVNGPVFIPVLKAKLSKGQITTACQVCAEGDFNEGGEGNWTGIQSLLSGEPIPESPPQREKSLNKRSEETAKDAWRRKHRAQRISSQGKKGTSISSHGKKGTNRFLQYHKDAMDWESRGVFGRIGYTLLFAWFYVALAYSPWGISNHFAKKKAEKQRLAELGHSPSNYRPSNYRNHNPWANRDIVSIEEIKTDASLNPIIGFGPRRNGRARPMVGALPQAGKIQWKVTWRDSSGVLRSQVVDKYPSRY